MRLWKIDDNTYHLKVWVDDKWMLLTSNNLNPRAWRLDLENAIRSTTLSGSLHSQREELELIRTHTTIVKHYRDLQGHCRLSDKSA